MVAAARPRGLIRGAAARRPALVALTLALAAAARRPALIALTLALAAALASGCGSGGSAADALAPATTAAPQRTPAPRRHATRPLPRATCPAGVPGCRSVRGRVVYVQRVDPDGDGDLHVVVLASGITLPGLTSVDVAPALRPRRDPRVGERVSAAGPVQRGSYGQRQIHALEFHAAR